MSAGNGTVYFVMLLSNGSVLTTCGQQYVALNSE